MYSKKQKDLIFRGFYNKMSKRLSVISKKKIRVKHTDNGLGCTDGNIVWLNEKQEIVPKAPEYALFFMKGVATHELGHILFTDFSLSEIARRKYTNAFEYQIYRTLDNIVEDTSIEYWLFRTLKGELPRALNYTIGEIFKSSPNIEESDSPMGQFLNALIQYGDVGLIKGHFTFDEAKEIFRKVLPVYDSAIEEASATERNKRVEEIFEISRPLWKDEAQRTNDLQEQMKNESQKHENSRGKGNCSDNAEELSDETGKTRENDKRKARRKKSKEILESENSKGSGKTNAEETGTDKNSDDKASDDEKSDGENEADDKETDKDSETSGDSESQEDSEDKSSDDKKETGGESETDDSRLTLEESDALEDLNDEGSIEDEVKEIMEEELKNIDDEIRELLAQEEKAEEEFKESSNEALPDFDINCKCNIKSVICKNFNMKIDNVEYAKDTYNEIVNRLAPEIRHLTGCLKAIIRQDVEEKEARTSGKINLERLSSGKRTARVFDRRIVPNKSNMAVFLAIDESGSMHCRYQIAKMAAIAIAESCHNVKLPIYIMGFTADEQRADAVHYHYVKWKNTLADRMSLMSISARSNNFDGYSIRYGAEILKKRPEQKKLMIVISDGQPAARAYRDYTVGGIADTKEAVRVANKSCIVQGVALGNSDTEVINEIYGGRNFIHVSKTEELLTELGKVLKKRLRA